MAGCAAHGIVMHEADGPCSDDNVGVCEASFASSRARALEGRGRGSMRPPGRAEDGYGQAHAPGMAAYDL